VDPETPLGRGACKGARAQPHHHQLNPHVRLPTDPPAGRVRASRQASSASARRRRQCPFPRHRRRRRRRRGTVRACALPPVPGGHCQGKNATRGLRLCEAWASRRHALGSHSKSPGPLRPTAAPCVVGRGGGRRPSWRGTEGSRPRGWPDEIIGGGWYSSYRSGIQKFRILQAVQKNSLCEKFS